MIRIPIILLFALTFSTLSAQEYDDYIGAGHAVGVSVSSSSSSNNTDAVNTINGQGMDAQKMEAARFLAQAGFGGSMDDVNHVHEIGFEQWIDDQINLPITSYFDEGKAIHDFLVNKYITTYNNAGYDPEEDDQIYIPGFDGTVFNYSWYNTMMTKEDQLRQRMAFSLSQILVISADSDLADQGEGLSTYLDLLMYHAFGNYEDLLFEVATNPCMGFYLSHLNNPKSDPENNIHPDENFAREIMQLFSIGIYELNMDGSWKLDGDGNPIQTYDLDDIRELAKVFTGMSIGGIKPNMCEWLDQPYFGLESYCGDLTVPMIMYEEWHEQGPKSMFGGDHVIPDGQSGMEDVEEAVSVLFNHPNTAPFISRLLIQRFVKSNPSPQYIQRVAETFADNGQGERGDLAAVIKAILLDDEARTCDALMDPDNGRLREPVLRMSQLMKAVEVEYVEGGAENFWHNGYDNREDLGQTPLWSRTVFNFYSPDYKIDEDLYGPEFEILNTVTTAGYFNRVNTWANWALTYDWLGSIRDPDPDNSEIELDTFADNRASISDEWINTKIEQLGVEGFVNELDITLTHGQLGDEYRQNIREVSEYFAEEHPWMFGYWEMRHYFYFMMVSPDFVILK